MFYYISFAFIFSKHISNLFNTHIYRQWKITYKRKGVIVAIYHKQTMFKMNRINEMCQDEWNDKKQESNVLKKYIIIMFLI